MAGDVPNDYLKDINYLKELPERGSLLATNSVYKELDQKAKNLPGLRRALSSLSVKY